MNFVYPGFLWASLVILIPIIIHLFHFRRYKKIIFPHVRFLQDIQRETQSVKKVRNLLVLISRILAILFLVFAFAQPFIPANSSRINPASDVVGIFIDNSFSMEARGKDGPVFEEAKEKAREVVGAMGNSTRFLLADNAGLISNRLFNRDDAIRRIDDMQIGHIPQNLTECLKIMRNGLDKNGVGRKNIFLISDFQKTNAFDPPNFLDSTFQITAVPVSAEQGRNISIDSAWLDDPQLTLNEAFTLNVKVTNQGESEILESTISLDVDGVRKSAAGFDAQAGESKVLSMGVTLTKTGWQKGQLRIEDEDLPFDNDYFISFNIKEVVKVLVVNGKSSNPYIDKLWGSDSYFALTNSFQGNLDLGNLKKSDLLILNEMDQLGNGIVESIKSYVESGGTVLVVPKVDAQNGYFINLTSALGLPGFGPETKTSVQISGIDANHPLFAKVFQKIPSNPDFPAVRRFYQLDQAGASVLLRMSNEQGFLVGKMLGNGQAFALASPLNEDWSSFPQHALFVPILYKMALSRSSDFPLSHTISRSNLFKSVVESGKMQGEISLKAGDMVWMPVLNQMGLVSYIDAGDATMPAGNIETLFRDSLVQITSFNYHRSESVSDIYSTDEIKTNLPGCVMNVASGGDMELSRSIKEQRLGKRFWKACVILALIFLAIEILLLRLWPTRQV